MRICVLVTGDSLATFLENLRSAEEQGDVVELRIDTISQLTVADLVELKRQVHKPHILTCRRQCDGGFFSGEESFRQALLQKALELGFDLVDVEEDVFGQVRKRMLQTQQESELDSIFSRQLLLSYHNMHQTPAWETLCALYQAMLLYRPRVIKIATMINNAPEVNNLYRLLLERSELAELVVVGMGALGVQTRVIAPFLGSFLTYAFVSVFVGGSSASVAGSVLGQVSAQTLRKIGDLITQAGSEAAGAGVKA